MRRLVPDNGSHLRDPRIPICKLSFFSDYLDSRNDKICEIRGAYASLKIWVTIRNIKGRSAKGNARVILGEDL